MNPALEQKLAQRLLETREQGWTYRRFLRHHTRRYVLLFVLHGLALLLFAAFQQWLPFYLVLGMLIGNIARDYGWARSISKHWPLSLKITDWARVQRMAQGKE